MGGGGGRSTIGGDPPGDDAPCRLLDHIERGRPRRVTTVSAADALTREAVRVLERPIEPSRHVEERVVRQKGLRGVEGVQGTVRREM